MISIIVTDKAWTAARSSARAHTHAHLEDAHTHTHTHALKMAATFIVRAEVRPSSNSSERLRLTGK